MHTDDKTSVWNNTRASDFHLILEGGAMRGMFTAGVLDHLMEQRALASRVYGTSAGALHGINYVAGDFGRGCFLNMKYCTDWRYLSMRNYAITGSAFGSKFLFDTIPNELEAYDYAHFADSPSTLVSVASNLERGEADYHESHDLQDARDIAYLTASASMPLVSKIVEVDNKLLLDGGTCDSVPYLHSQRDGAKKQVIVLTREDGFVKKPNMLMALAQARYNAYPLFLERMANRHNEYNLTYQRIKELELEGRVFVIRPQQPVTIASMENDPDKLLDLYGQGYGEAMRVWPALERYLKDA